VPTFEQVRDSEPLVWDRRERDEVLILDAFDGVGEGGEGGPLLPQGEVQMILAQSSALHRTLGNKYNSKAVTECTTTAKADWTEAGRAQEGYRGSTAVRE
jgi:hypothetical protein